MGEKYHFLFSFVIFFLRQFIFGIILTVRRYIGYDDF